MRSHPGWKGAASNYAVPTPASQPPIMSAPHPAEHQR